ncbi:MAG: ABC transporter substrate-binding protein [Gammaproteobacteria bacterium]
MQWHRRVLLCLLLLAAMPAWAAALVIRVTGPEPVAAELASLLTQRLPGVAVHRSGGSVDLRIAVGTRDFEEALAEAAQTPVVGVALTRRAWLAAAGQRPGPHTAIFWEPDPVRHLRLARAMMPGARRAGVLLSADDPALVAALRAEAARQKLELIIERLGPGDSLARSVNNVLGASDFLLGVDDPDIFSPATAKTLLLTSYRHGKPVIGPTAAYVDAGSAASLVVTLADVADTLAAWLPELFRARDVLPPPRHVDTANVRTNAQVARSLRLSIPPPTALEALMKTPGGSP